MGGSLSSRLEELRSESLSLSLETTGKETPAQEVTPTGHHRQACQTEGTRAGLFLPGQSGIGPPPALVFGARGQWSGDRNGRVLLSVSQRGESRCEEAGTRGGSAQYDQHRQGGLSPQAALSTHHPLPVAESEASCWQELITPFGAGPTAPGNV